MRAGVPRPVVGGVGATAVLAACMAAGLAARPAEPPALSEPLPFVAHTIDTEAPSGYQVVVTDLSGDGLPDIVALSTRQPDLVWYENPRWERHVIATGLSRMINVAAHDVDGDGIPELALAHRFSSTYDDSAGIVSLLTSRKFQG